MACLKDAEHLDASLAARVRAETALRLRLGQLLEVIGRGAVFELGFSSLSAYAVERCERSARWAEAARCVARRLEALPELRRAMATGEVSWSMGELLARGATPADEGRWLELAKSRTVRQMRRLLPQLMSAGHERATTGVDDDGVANLQSDGGEPMCTLTCTVDREDAWLFEATRCLLEQLGTQGTAAQTEALVAEAQTTLLALLPKGERDLEDVQEAESAWRRRVDELGRWREAAEASCEKNVLADLLSARAANPDSSSLDGAAPFAAEVIAVAIDVSLGMAGLEKISCTELDQALRRTTVALARHELELAMLLLQFHRVDGWRRLGYATETQYARERLGSSRSSLLARRALALRLEKLPGVAEALGAAQIGVEAALQLVRIATPKTEAAWVERARRRTIKHLREEVAAALTAVRHAGESDCPPPEDDEIAEYQDLERAVVSGRFGQPRAANDACEEETPVECSGEASAPAAEGRRPWRVMLGSLASWLASGVQMSAARAVPAGRACSSAGRVTLRLRTSRETFIWWRGLEAKARSNRLLGEMSWLRFVCYCLWHAWCHLLAADTPYGHIYIRDRFKCTSPVCNRRDVTPHHLVFRSAGGSDADDNVTTVCAWCHLHGIHGGRIRALGPASRIRWEIGPRNAPRVVVHGRDRMVA